MLSIILTCVLVSAFFAIEFFSGKYAAEEKTLKVTRPLSILLNVAPLAGILIFSVLFAFVLKGQLWERISHAVFVLAAWMYATRFYLILLSHFSKLPCRHGLCRCLGGIFYAAKSVRRIAVCSHESVFGFFGLRIIDRFLCHDYP